MNTEKTNAMIYNEPPSIITKVTLDRYFLKATFLRLLIYMYTLELGVFMFKSSFTDLPVAFKDFFTKRSDTHDYPTRHVNDFNLTNNKKAFSDHAIERF